MSDPPVLRRETGLNRLDIKVLTSATLYNILATYER